MRYRFNKQEKKPRESVSTYVAELRSVAEYCNYGLSQDATLKDHIVCRINHCCRKEWSEAKLTNANMLEISKGFEEEAQTYYKRDC